MVSYELLQTRDFFSVFLLLTTEVISYNYIITKTQVF